jgi:hypothetical protein
MVKEEGVPPPISVAARSASFGRGLRRDAGLSIDGQVRLAYAPTVRRHRHVVLVSG